MAKMELMRLRIIFFYSVAFYDKTCVFDEFMAAILDLSGHIGFFYKIILFVYPITSFMPKMKVLHLKLTVFALESHVLLSKWQNMRFSVN